MAKEGIIRMSVMEIKRAGIIQRVIGRELTQVKAGEVLGLSDRQVRRLVRRVEEKGVEGLVHRSRGRPGSKVIKEREKILKLYDKKYPDFGPTFASEKLWELDGLRVNHETLREWLLERGRENEWRRKKRPHKKWRPRKECFGEMVQMDGSHHDWLEGRGPRTVFLGGVDDATGNVFGRFYKYEGVKTIFDLMYRYIEKYGIPHSVYVDRHSTYKTTRHQTIFEQLMDEKAMTQFERAMKELGVEVIHANSPQAKGRIENKFGTLQDRFVKELRLAGIDNIGEANKFGNKYLPKLNNKFSVPPKRSVDLHRKCPPKHILDAILCIKEERTLRKNSTVRYNNKVYLVTNQISRRVSKVTVEERLDGSIRIMHKDRYLKYKEIEPSVRVPRADKIQDLPLKAIKGKRKKSSKPSKDHPWKKQPPFRYIDPKKYLAHLNEYALLNK